MSQRDGRRQRTPASDRADRSELVARAHGAADLPNDAPPRHSARRDDVQRVRYARGAQANADLASYEQIRRVIVIPREFSVEGGELSPSMKIKRRVVEERYAAEIERAYGVDFARARAA